MTTDLEALPWDGWLVSRDPIDEVYVVSSSRDEVEMVVVSFLV